MPGQPYLLRYFITLRPKATFPSYYEWMQLIYQNNGWLIEGHGGYEGPSWGDWEALIKPGPWWDGTKPQFVLKDSTWLPMSHDDVLDMLMDCYALEDIWISWTMKEYKMPGGCVVWVQKADTPNPNHWHVWHTPMIDMRKVLLTHPNDWTDWGWYDDVTSAPVEQQPTFWQQVKAKAKEQRTWQRICARAKGKGRGTESFDRSYNEKGHTHGLLDGSFGQTCVKLSLKESNNRQALPSG